MIIQPIDVRKTTPWGESGFPSEFLANRLLPSDMAGGLSQAKHQRSASEENAGPSTPAQKVEESHGQSHVPQEQAVPLLPVPELHSTVDVPARQHGQGPAGDSDMAQHLDNPADGEVYQSDVKVSVETHGETKQMIAFLNKLQGSSELRMLWMVGNDQGATMWLALRQPLRLKELFLQMESVIEVRDRPSRGAGSPEHVLEVVLGGSPKVAAVT